jgi:hypothetical protein
MALLPSSDWRVAEAIAGIGYCNPFLPERVELERRALGRRYISVGPVIQARPGAKVEELFPNIPALHKRAQELVEAARRQLIEGAPVAAAELVVYEDLALYFLYGSYMSSLDGLVTRSMDQAGHEHPVPFWREFEADFNRLLRLPGCDLPSGYDPAIIFAGLYQIQRAFTHVFDQIVGGVHAGGAAPGRGLAVGLHARHAALRPRAPPEDVRHPDAHRGPIRQRQGTRRPGHRAIGLHPVQPQVAALRHRGF